MTDLYKVTCYKLSEDLFDVVPDPDTFPLRFPEDPVAYHEDLKSRLHHFDPTDTKDFRHKLSQLGRDIHEKTVENLCVRVEDFGMFLSFENAERYVIEGVNDWDECGYYNIARIALFSEGLIYAQSPKKTWWYKILEQQTRGYDQPPLQVEKIDPPQRFKNYYWREKRI